MNEKIIKYKIEDGKDIAIMTIEPPVPVQDSDDLKLASKGIPGKAVQYASDVFTKNLDHIKSLALLFSDALKEVQPDELSVEFGVTFTADAGVIISLGTDFNLKINLTWKKGTT